MNQRIFYFLLCDAFIFLLTYRKAEETPTYLWWMELIDVNKASSLTAESQFWFAHGRSRVIYHECYVRLCSPAKRNSTPLGNIQNHDR